MALFSAIGAVLVVLLLQVPLDGNSVLRRVEDQVVTIKDYTVTLDVVADIERISVPPMHATMYYKHPEKVHIDSKGFALLPRESMGLQFGGLVKRFAVDSTSREKGRVPAMYRLVLRPRDERDRVRKVVLWVNTERWTPDRIVIPQADGRAMTADFTYMRVGSYWLPDTLVVSFTMPREDSTGSDLQTNPLLGRSPPSGVGARGGERTGTITVRYSDYHVNTGLRDEIFAEPPSSLR